MFASAERSETQLQSKTNIALFCKLNVLILGLKSVIGIKATKIAREIKFKGVRNELEPKKGFQRQAVTQYLRLTLVYHVK